MATTITAGNSTNGAAISSDNTGILELKTGTGAGTTGLTIGTNQQVQYTAGTAAAPAITFSGDPNTGIYSPGADRIGFAEGGTQVGEFDASGNFLFNSGYGSTAVAYGCRAWVNFNGQGTVAIRASGNVTSITDNSTGNYTVNFTNSMSDANYAVQTNSNFGTNAQQDGAAFNLTASNYRIYTTNGGVVADNNLVTSSVFR
jgi:hypothetical protein